jgi:dienelactone hydrolase
MTTIDEILATVPAPAGSAVTLDTVVYEHDGTPLEGVLAKDTASSGPRPGVLVIHDWLGVSPNVEARTTMLARLGYVALGADIYGQGVRPTHDTAPDLVKRYYGDLPLMRARARAGLDRLLADPDVDPSRIAVLGYCFGGSASLELARTGVDIAGAISFHGNLLTHDPSDAADIRAKLLVLTGANDPVVPDDKLAAWEDEMRAAPDVDWQVTSYAGAVHAFTVPGPMYQERADRRSWQALEVFLAEIFDEELAAL